MSIRRLDEWPWDVTDSAPAADAAGTLWPKITIITPTLNQARFLEECLRSVIFQNYPNLEYMVVDGGSHDGSVEIIKKYSDSITWWVSEKDQGQTEAINKGLCRAQGDLINWINSDDLLEPGALHAIGKAYLRNPNSVITGRTRRVDLDTSTCTIHKVDKLPDVKFWESHDCHQQGIFLPLTVWRETGGLDPNLQFCMDYDLYCRVRNANVIQLDVLLSEFRVHSDCKTSNMQKTHMRERTQVSKRYWQFNSITAQDQVNHDHYVSEQVVANFFVAIRQNKVKDAMEWLELWRPLGLAKSSVAKALFRLLATRLKERCG